MAGSSYLLDTMIVAAYFNREQAVLDRLENITLYVSSITIGELYFGAYNSSQVTNNLDQIRRFAAFVTVIPVEAGTADQYGQIKHALRVKGRPIPENDIWIAATAIQYGLVLATRDAHFNEIDGFLPENW